MTLELVSNISQAMQVRALRNSCREHLTNYRSHIGVLKQLLWYFRYYRDAKQAGKYRLYLLYDAQRVPVGFGALSLEAERLLVTECVAAKYRRAGKGQLLLDYLIRIASEERRDVVAEIWSTNQGSIALHEKAGFKLESVTIKGGKEARQYLLQSSAIRANGNLAKGSAGVAQSKHYYGGL